MYMLHIISFALYCTTPSCDFSCVHDLCGTLMVLNMYLCVVDALSQERSDDLLIVLVSYTWGLRSFFGARM